MSKCSLNTSRVGGSKLPSTGHGSLQRSELSLCVGAGASRCMPRHKDIWVLTSHQLQGNRRAGGKEIGRVLWGCLLGQLWLSPTDVMGLWHFQSDGGESGCRHVCRASAPPGFFLWENRREKREKKNEGKKKRKEKGEKERKNPDARYLRTRISCMGLDSEKQILSWMWKSRLLPENVSSCPSDSAVSRGGRGRPKAPQGTGPAQCCGQQQDVQPWHCIVPCWAVRGHPSTSCRWKTVCKHWGWLYRPRGMIQKAEPIWRVILQRKYIYGNMSLAIGGLFFFPLSLMSSLSNPDRFLQNSVQLIFAL